MAESCFNPPQPTNTPHSRQSGMAVTKPLIFGMDAERGEPRGLEGKDTWVGLRFRILSRACVQSVLFRGKALTLLNEEGRVSMQSTWLWSILPRTAAMCSRVSRVCRERLCSRASTSIRFPDKVCNQSESQPFIASIRSLRICPIS